MTDALGVLTVDMPAFESPAFVTVRLADGETASELVTIPDLAQYERVGLAWDGDRALELHAMEDGAAFGGPGHVWQDAAGSADMAETGAGGFLTLLGDADAPDPMLAQVYTLPRSFLDDGRRVDLSIDAPVTEANCGLPTDAVTLRMQDAQSVDVTDLSFNTPGCEAVGDILVLQNLLGPLRLAAN